MRKDNIGIDLMLLITFYSANNLGDDLFIIHLCEHYKHEQFLMYCPYEFSSPFQSIKNLKLVFNVGEIEQFHSLIYLQILIGGSLFMQPKNEDDIYDKYLFNKKYRYFDDKPFIIIGANFGPFNSSKHYILHKKWFSSLEHISFRDKYSLRLFNELDNVSYAPDMLFGYTLPNVERKHKVGISCIYNNNRIGLSNYNEKSYIDFLIHVCNKYAENEFSIVLFSFCNKQGDNIAVKKIFDGIRNKERTEIIEYTGNIYLFLNNLLSCEYIIGTRFHSIVLALSAGIPVFPIIYNLKTQNLLTDLEFAGHSIPIEDCSNITFDYVDYNRKMNISLGKLNRYIFTRALKHFDSIDHYLKNNGG